MKLRMTIILLFLLLLPSFAFSTQPVIRIQYESRPTISRFRGFTGIIEQSTLGRVDTGSFRLYVNGLEHSSYLRTSTDPQSGNIIIAYKPVQALKDGKNRFKLLFSTLDGKRMERSWTQEVAPGRDPALAPFVTAIRKNTRDTDAHLQLAKGYEKKFLMEDAQEEYRIILEINPKHEEAKHSYNRIFALWGRKAIGKRGVIMDVTMEEGLIPLGGPLVFKVVVENTTNRQISISKKDIFLLDSQGNQIEPWKDLNSYPRIALDQGWISLEDYVRLSYRIEIQPLQPFNVFELYPKTNQAGFFAFRLSSMEIRRVILLFSKVTIGTKTTEFHFPFTRS